MYVETVVGPDTVNTMPPNTLDALLDHGTIVADTVESDLDARASRRDARPSDAKISLFDVMHEAAEPRACRSSRDSFAALLGAIVYKQKLLASGGAERVRFRWARRSRTTMRRSNGWHRPTFSSGSGRTTRALWSTDPDAAAIIKKSLGLARHPAAHARIGRRLCGPSAARAKQKFRVRRRLRHGRQFARARHHRRYVRRRRDPIRNSTCSIRRVRSRSKSSKRRSTFRDALHHFEQERHDDRTQRVLRILPR